MNGLFSTSVSLPLSLDLSTFERLMELILDVLRFETCLIYFEAAIVYGRIVVEELEPLEKGLLCCRCEA